MIEYADVVARGRRAARPTPRLLLPVPVDQLGAIEVADAGTLHRFERDAAGAWFYHGAHAGAGGGARARRRSRAGRSASSRRSPRSAARASSGSFAARQGRPDVRRHGAARC